MTEGTPINVGDVAGAISSFYGVAPGNAAVTKLLEVIMPDVRQASARDPNSWKSVFPIVLAKYDSMARELGLGTSQSQRDLDVLRTANRTDANFVAALGRLGFTGAHPYSMLNTRSGEERGEAPSSSRAGSGNGAVLSATAAADFARELGISPAHTGLFAGGSREMRDALRDAVKNGAAISEDHVKSMKDVGMVLGAIRAGKLSSDDPRIPESVKKVVKDMKDKGIDPTTADTRTIQGYLKDNPKALETAKQEIAKDKASAAKLSDDQLSSAVQKQTDQAATKAKPATVKTIAKTL